MRNTLLLILCLFTVSGIAYAGPWIHGHAYYDSVPVDGAKVWVLNTLTGVAFTDYTDSTGTFWYTLYGSGETYFQCIMDPAGHWAHTTFTTTGADIDLGNIYLSSLRHPRHPAIR